MRKSLHGQGVLVGQLLTPIRPGQGWRRPGPSVRRLEL